MMLSRPQHRQVGPQGPAELVTPPLVMDLGAPWGPGPILKLGWCWGRDDLFHRRTRLRGNSETSAAQGRASRGNGRSLHSLFQRCHWRLSSAVFQMLAPLFAHRHSRRPCQMLSVASMERRIASVKFMCCFALSQNHINVGNKLMVDSGGVVKYAWQWADVIQVCQKPAFVGRLARVKFRVEWFGVAQHGLAESPSPSWAVAAPWVGG